MLQQVIRQEMPKHYSGDPLEHCLVCDKLPCIEDDESGEFVHFLEAQPYIQPQKAKIEELRLENLSILIEKKIPQVKLKPLPPLLRYEFLGPNCTYPVIINANLSKIKPKKLLHELRLRRKAICYTIDDIKGINPSICMHRILLENNYKPFMEPQRRLNPNIKKLVEKEIPKLLDAGVIHRIFQIVSRSVRYR